MNYQNIKIKMLFLLKNEGKVYLLKKNIKKKKYKKFNYIKVRPFFIKIIKKTISYKLRLFNAIKLYLVFHILLFELVDFKISK